MQKGRKAKPFLLKVNEGNRGHRKLKPGIEPPAGPFEPPFPLDGVALLEWTRILAEAPWLRASESMAIADRCLCVQRMLEAEQDIRDRGTIIHTRNGKVKNPSIQISRSYRLSVQRYDAELGLTASTRSRMDPDMPKGGGRMDALEEKLCG